MPNGYVLAQASAAGGQQNSRHMHSSLGMRQEPNACLGSGVFLGLLAARETSFFFSSSSLRESWQGIRRLQLPALGFCRASCWDASDSQLTKGVELKEGLEQFWVSGQDREENKGV